MALQPVDGSEPQRPIWLKHEMWDQMKIIVKSEDFQVS